MRLVVFLAVAVSLLAPTALLAEEGGAGDSGHAQDRYVREALEKAGPNRPELELALAQARASGDAEKLQAARFLIANMPGKGYVITQLRTPDGKPLSYDPLSYVDLGAAHSALDALEKEHGELAFARDDLVEDVRTIEADFLLRHIDGALAAWRATSEADRVGFDAFLQYVLPYRGSQEPLDDWLMDLRRRYAARARAMREGKLAREDLYKWVTKDISRRVRFDERYYLHPTDQSFTEMGRSGQGRCEDITNMQTFAARSLALATAADYTPAWAHRDNNHAWNVLLDAKGRGAVKAYAHAAKVYRKTFAIQRENLGALLPQGRAAPNRFLKSMSYLDVTDQYGPTTDVTVHLDPAVVGAEKFAYLCVFNGGRWVAIHWGRIEAEKGQSQVTFDRMGGNIAYLPAIHDGEKLIPAADPLIVHKDGTIERLRGLSEGSPLLLTSVAPRRKSVDTHVVTPISYLEEGTTYELSFWNGAWESVTTFTAGKEPVPLARLPQDGLYWLVAKDARKLERIFTIQDGRQRWW